MNGITLISCGVCPQAITPTVAPIGAAAEMQIPRDRSWAVVVPRSMAIHPAAAPKALAGTVAARAPQRFPVSKRSPRSI